MKHYPPDPYSAILASCFVLCLSFPWPQCFWFVLRMSHPLSLSRSSGRRPAGHASCAGEKKVALNASREKTVAYMNAWLVRACLLALMARDGVPRLKGASTVMCDDFATSCPDSKEWFTRLPPRQGRLSLTALFDILDYTGPPELFSMYSCVLLTQSMWVNPLWLEDRAQELRSYSSTYEGNHCLEPVPALVVKAVHGSTRKSRG